eukprot:scaffold48005_cov31-Tisochrysis_lutea.AAC.3
MELGGDWRRPVHYAGATQAPEQKVAPRPRFGHLKVPRVRLAQCCCAPHDRHSGSDGDNTNGHASPAH